MKHFKYKYKICACRLPDLASSLLTRIVCWKPWQTVWTHNITCTHRLSVLIWVQTIWYSDCIPERIFRKSWFWKKFNRQQKKMQIYPAWKELGFQRINQWVGHSLNKCAKPFFSRINAVVTTALILRHSGAIEWWLLSSADKLCKQFGPRSGVKFFETLIE